VATQVFTQLDKIEELTRYRAKEVPGASASTPAEYQEINEKSTALFQQIVKKVERGELLSSGDETMWDPLSGKVVIPFAKATKASSGARLMYALYIFVSFYTGVLKKAPKLYFRFVKMIVQVVDVHGFAIGHQLVDAVLRKLDEGFYTHPGALMQAGEHNTLLDMIVRAAASLPKQRGFGVFGVVTTPMGGPGAALAKDGAGVPMRCKAFFATPRQACTHGVHVGHSSGKAGQCMFQH
jgi:hypothetical protein